MTLDSGAIRNIIEVIGTFFAMGMSVYAVVRSSKQKQNDNIEKLFQQHSDSLTKLGETLQSHAEDDIAIQTELQTELRNNVKLAEKLDSKLDKVLERI